MKTTIYLLLLLALASSYAASDDQPKAPPELLALKQRYEKDIEGATKTIRERYIADLQRILRSTTQKGDFGGAQAIQTELTGLSVTPAISGKWRFTWAGGSSEFGFKEDGTFTMKGGKTGKWSLETDKILVKYPDGHTDTLFLPIDPKGTKGLSWVGPEFTATKISQ